MKVWIISNMYPSTLYPYFGIFVKNIVDGLLKNNVSIVRKSLMLKPKNNNHKIISYIKFIIDILLAGFNNDYDLIYIHFVKYSFFPAFLFKYLKKTKLVYNFHGTDALVYGVFRKFISWIVQRADLVVVPSEPFKREVAVKFRLKSELIFVSPSGGIDEIFVPYQRIGLEPRIKIGFISNIVRMKGWEVLIDAFSVFIKKYPNTILLIAGNGPDAPVMLDKIGRLSLGNNCRYLGAVSHDELVKIYNELTFLVFPSYRESLGLVGLEAMACGIPVIGSDVEGINSYVIEGFNGYLFKPGDCSDLQLKMELFINSEENIKTVLRKNAIYTADRYKATRVAKDLTNKLLSLCG